MAKILAIALKSFYLDTEVKTTSSKPFEVDEHHFNELKHNGLVARAPEEATEADVNAAEADAKAAAEAESKAKEEADAKAAAAAAKKAKA
ncbi:hypothetical protein [Shewanella xiamenensis]|uniref:hypothetical protein n=1 Tax=Shewanella xiamenensis TaxID=332186 RepID=UPI00217E4FE6|nr:hypothetical protein [Shewanella xiamenensis]MCT8871546.1 hypothetical protein [Shewanella xiamenensis]UWH43614.1 hypothetical protein KXJ80_10430 [Shewanella xiamenensis]